MKTRPYFWVSLSNQPTSFDNFLISHLHNHFLDSVSEAHSTTDTLLNWDYMLLLIYIAVPTTTFVMLKIIQSGFTCHSQVLLLLVCWLKKLYKSNKMAQRSPNQQCISWDNARRKKESGKGITVIQTNIINETEFTLCNCCLFEQKLVSWVHSYVHVGSSRGKGFQSVKFVHTPSDRLVPELVLCQSASSCSTLSDPKCIFLPSLGQLACFSSLQHPTSLSTQLNLENAQTWI